MCVSDIGVLVDDVLNVSPLLGDWGQDSRLWTCCVVDPIGCEAACRLVAGMNYFALTVVTYETLQTPEIGVLISGANESYCRFPFSFNSLLEIH